MIRSHHTRWSLFCIQAFMFANVQHTKLRRCHTHHDYVWSRESLARVCWKAKCKVKTFTQLLFCQPHSQCVCHHYPPLQLQQFNFLHFYIYSWCGEAARLLTGSREWITFESERIWAFIPPHDAAAPPRHSGCLEGSARSWEQMFSVIRIKGSFQRSGRKRQNAVRVREL